MNMGIIQGRLLPPVNNFIQKFPEGDWRNEFELLEDMGLTHIEWLVTEERFEDNPLFTKDIRDLPIAAFGLDVMNNSGIAEGKFFQDHMFPIAEAVLGQGYNKLSLPLLEASSMRFGGRKQIRAYLHNLLRRYPTLEVSLELDLFWAEDILDLVDHDRLFVTYDIGNLTGVTAEGVTFDWWRPHREFLETLYYAGKIDCIHLKDKNYGGVNVTPGEGRAPFKEIFKWLSTRDLSDVLYTLQTARGETGKEMETIIKHMDYFEDLHEKFV